MELPGGDDEWLASSPSPPGPTFPDRHDEHEVGTFIWPPVGDPHLATSGDFFMATDMPIWAAQRRTLLTPIDTPGLSSCRKETLQRELSTVEAILDKSGTDKEQA